jgi:biopolymer transport protein ExbD
MNFRRGRGREVPEINLIAFIDVLLVILIFLMVSTTYSKYTELQITLPSADAEKALERSDQINVTVDAKGSYTVNNVRVSFNGVASLVAALKAAGGAVASAGGASAPVVVINADQFAMHQMVINVMEAARLAGYDKLTFATQTSIGTSK